MTPESRPVFLAEDELEILKEIMNIAFGKATADLAELINIFITLTVPDVRIVATDELQSYIKEEVREYDRVSLVEQKFWGEFNGSALMIFPSDSGRELITLLTNEGTDSLESDPISELEKGTLMEIGNILIGACVGRIAELLGDVLTYSPPIVYVERLSKEGFFQQSSDTNSPVITLKTLFNFENKDVTGFLFLVTSHKSIAWLSKSLNEFLEQYT